MAKFKFSLERPLRIILQQEEIKKRALAIVLRQLQDEEAKLTALRETKQALLLELAKLLDGPLDIEQLVWYQNYSKRLSQEIVNQQEAVKAAEQEVDLKRHELTQVAKKRLALEELKDQQHKKFKKTQEKAEQNSSDESNITMSAWRHRKAARYSDSAEKGWRAKTEEAEHTA